LEVLKLLDKLEVFLHFPKMSLDFERVQPN
jgi:hypothetical protein